MVKKLDKWCDINWIIFLVLARSGACQFAGIPFVYTGLKVRVCDIFAAVQGNKFFAGRQVIA